MVSEGQLVEWMRKYSPYDYYAQNSIMDKLERTTNPNSIDEIAFNADNRKQVFTTRTRTDTRTRTYVKDGVVRKTKENMQIYRETRRDPARFWWF